MAAFEGRGLAWGLAATLLLANVAGYAFDLYAAFWWFDRILHAATLFALTFWFAQIVLGDAIREDHAVRIRVRPIDDELPERPRQCHRLHLSPIQ